jgi:predicted lipoprotein with Yx(FWY)xxD motif
MHRAKTVRLGAGIALIALVGLLAAFYAVRADGATRVRVVMTAKNKTLGKKVLVNLRGMTLYSLSAERNGRFICTNSMCLSLWKPLVVAKGAVPTGAARLTVVKRPDGRRQVAYRGGPLYTFSLDKRAGDVKGDGFKDVGVWRPATLAAQKTSPPPPSSGGGYGGGGYGP